MIMMSIYASAPGAAWYLDSRLWVAIPVVLFLAFIAYKGAFKALGSALDARADGIKTELEEARRLREEAQALLASYQRKQKEAEEQAESIVAQARKDAELMAAQSRKALTERLERRTAQAESKIETAEAQAMAQVKSKAADMALEAAESLLRSKLSAAEKSSLIKDGISQMGKVLN